MAGELREAVDEDVGADRRRGDQHNWTLKDEREQPKEETQDAHHDVEQDVWLLAPDPRENEGLEDKGEDHAATGTDDKHRKLTEDRKDQPNDDAGRRRATVCVAH